MCKADGTVVIKSTRKNSYEDKGNLLETSESNSDGTLVKKETLVYDKTGNWLKKTMTFRNVKNNVSLEREIRYY